MKLRTLELIGRGMDEADATHQAAEDLISGKGILAGRSRSLEAIALALLAIDQRILTLGFGWLEEKRDEIEHVEQVRADLVAELDAMKEKEEEIT